MLRGRWILAMAFLRAFPQVDLQRPEHFKSTCCVLIFCLVTRKFSSEHSPSPVLKELFGRKLIDSADSEPWSLDPRQQPKQWEAMRRNMIPDYRHGEMREARWRGLGARDEAETGGQSGSWKRCLEFRWGARQRPIMHPQQPRGSG